MPAYHARRLRPAVRRPGRTRGLTARDVDRQLDERRLVVAWLNRGTLHLVRADYWWLQPLALVDGRAVATWSLERSGVDLQVFDSVSAADRRAVEDEARDVVRFLG